MAGPDDALQRIRNSLEAAKARTRHFRRLNSCAIFVSIIVGALAAFLAGAAATGEITSEADTQGQIVYALNVFGMSYRTVCGVAAILSLLAAISSGLQKGLDLPGKEGKARSCMARLIPLELAASTKRHSQEQIEEEYGKVLGEYPELFA